MVRDGRNEDSLVVDAAERDGFEDGIAYASAEEFWRRREQRMATARSLPSTEDRYRERQTAAETATPSDVPDASHFLRFVTSLNKFMDASREVERGAASVSKAMQTRGRNDKRLHGRFGSDAVGPEREIEALLLRIDTLKRHRGTVDELLPRVSSLAIAAEAAAHSFSSRPQAGEGIIRLAESDGDGSTDTARLRRARGKFHGASMSSEFDDAVRSASSARNAARNRVSISERRHGADEWTSDSRPRAHDTFADISRLRDEYLQAVERIKRSHDKHVRLLQKTQRDELARLGAAHEKDLMSKTRAQEDAMLRLLSRLGVSGDVISTFVEGFAHFREETESEVPADTDVAYAAASALSMSQHLVRERQQREELEVKLTSLETEASTSREYALFKQRQHYDARINKLEREHGEAQTRQTAETAAAIKTTLAPVHDRLQNLRHAIGTEDPQLFSPKRRQQQRGSAGVSKATNEDTRSRTQVGSVADELIDCLTKLEVEVRDRVGSARRGIKGTENDAAREESAAREGAKQEEGAAGPCMTRTRDAGRNCKREQEYDTLLSELRAMEKKAIEIEHTAELRDARGAPYEDTDERCGVDADACMLTVSSSSSDDGEVIGVNEATAGPPQPRRFLPAALSADRRRQIRRKDSESDVLHPGIARLLVKGVQHV